MTDMSIHGFEMIEESGRGGMATVWKARQISLDRIVAIKILSSQFASEPSDVEMFKKEAQQAAKLKHPGIIQVYDAHAENGLYYFVMEYVAGYTVGDWIRRKGVLDEKDVLLVAECVAAALEYAWNTARIIHCDIKPDNIIIDADGTVKIADLGLARTLSVMTELVESEEVMGTPAYIAPEQAMGRSDIDFRADVYSLGAMMYHLATGRILFAGSSDDDAMELQVSGAVEDPIDINPSLSKPFCWLVEKMLAKEPAWRPASWEEVRKDVERVKKKIVPIGCLSADQTSTVSRSSKRTRMDLKRVVADDENKPSGFTIALKVALAAGMLTFAAYYGFHWRKQNADNRQETAIREAAIYTVPVVEDSSGRKTMRDQDAKEMFEYALTWAQDNPEGFADAIDRFNKVVRQTAGTKYSLMASDETKKLQKEWSEGKAKVLKQLKDDAEYFLKNGEFDHAAGIYKKYNGPLCKDTEVERSNTADEILSMKSRHEEEELRRIKAMEQKFEDILNGTVAKILEDDISSAAVLLASAIYDNDFFKRSDILASLNNVLVVASKMDQRILDSFSAQIGKTVPVLLNSGRKDIKIESIKGPVISGKQPLGSANVMMHIEFSLNDLSLREKLARMGDDSDPAVAMVKGVMAYQSGSIDYAKAYFGMTHELISDRLISRIDTALKGPMEAEASDALIYWLKNAGIDVPSKFDEWEWGTAIANKEFNESEVAQAVSFVDEYRAKYGKTEYCRKAVLVLEAILNTTPHAEAPNSPEASEPPTETPVVITETPVVIDVAGAVGNNDKIIELLLAANSSLTRDNIQVLTDSAGNTYKVSIISREIRDISPVAAFKGLREFYCGGVEPDNTEDRGAIAPLSDISPLAGLPLEVLYLAQTSVKTLDALKAMKKLRDLDVSRTDISDLTPLRYAQLERLIIADTRVKDLLPLQGMNLRVLDISGTNISDFKPLSRLRVNHLALARTQFRDLGIIKGLPITHLSLADTKVYDFKPLSAFSFELLDLEGTQIKDISFLSKMPLKTLSLGRTAVKDFSVLELLPLISLRLGKTSLKDINFMMKQMQLSHLDISDTDVSDLWPLTNSRLRFLDISHTKVTDLFPMTTIWPLKILKCYGVKASVMPLMRTQLTHIYLDHPRDSEVLRVLFRIHSLEKINGRYKDFWLQRVP